MPLRTQAIALEIAEGTFLIGGAILAAFGITITANNDEVISDWLDSCCDDVKNWIYEAGDTWVTGYNKILEISGEMWDKIKSDVYNHFDDFVSSSVHFLSFSKNESGIYGCTNNADNRLEISIPAMSASSSCYLYSEKYTIRFMYNYRTSSVFDFSLLNKDVSNSQSFSAFDFQFSSNSSLAHVYVNPFLCSISDSQNLVSAYAHFDTYKYSLSLVWNFGSNSPYQSYFPLFGQLVNGHYFVTQSTSEGYAFYDTVDKVFIPLSCKGQTKTFFDSEMAIWEWLLESVGLAHDNTAGLFDSVAADKDVLFNDDVLTNDVVIDKDYFPTNEDVEAETKEAVQIVVPATLEDITTEKVLNKDADDVYPSDKFPDLDIPMSLWDKFPFCLPKDLYNLFACFFSDTSSSSPPPIELPIDLIFVKHTVIISFDNSDMFTDTNTTHVGLADFEILVKILRFFIALFFVYGLIVLTRKLIGA